MANTISISDGTTIYHKDWGGESGQPIMFSHSWPLDADAFEDQMFFLAAHGYRCIDQIVPIKASAMLVFIRGL
ncbi:alpha/beta fold hydrolase [Noviherbaspirillum malthae]|jgi:non-heme chloroperoxidase|uniref:alpha/beta fold hydrolase n=1 Tax=Noviherbaspirillum malthae TaxID=1260987 RepID=UPI003F69F9D6